MASFESVNYVLRPNKSVERKLIFETFSQLGKDFDIANYRYVGMGSMWFADFVIAHKFLGIDKLISFEHADYADRAKFNRPYKAIEVFGGSASVGIEELDWDCDSIVWLDYDTGPEGPAFTDVSYLAERMSAGSFLLVTLNAHLGRIPLKDGDGREISRHQGLQILLGEFAPDPDEFPALNAKSYPKALARSLVRCIERVVRRSGSGLRFVPFMSFAYSDNAPMITVGGAFVDDIFAEKISNNLHVNNAGYLNKELFEINIPHLTQKERTVLDGMLPATGQILERDFKEAFGFKIGQKHLDGYSQFYKLYPVFGEVFV